MKTLLLLFSAALLAFAARTVRYTDSWILCFYDFRAGELGFQAEYMGTFTDATAGIQRFNGGVFTPKKAKAVICFSKGKRTVCYDAHIGEYVPDSYTADTIWRDGNGREIKAPKDGAENLGRIMKSVTDEWPQEAKDQMRPYLEAAGLYY